MFTFWWIRAIAVIWFDWFSHTIGTLDIDMDMKKREIVIWKGICTESLLGLPFINKHTKANRWSSFKPSTKAVWIIGVFDPCVCILYRIQRPPLPIHDTTCLSSPHRHMILLLSWWCLKNKGCIWVWGKQTRRKGGYEWCLHVSPDLMSLFLGLKADTSWQR